MKFQEIVEHQCLKILLSMKSSTKNSDLWLGLIPLDTFILCSIKKTSIPCLLPFRNFYNMNSVHG